MKDKLFNAFVITFASTIAGVVLYQDGPTPMVVLLIISIILFVILKRFK